MWLIGWVGWGGGEKKESPQAGFMVAKVRPEGLGSPPAETHNKAGPSQSARSPTVLEAQSPLKLDSLFHHASGNNLIKGQLRAKEAHHPILDDPQSTDMESK